MLNDEEVESLCPLLEAKDADTVRLGLAIIKDQASFSTEDIDKALKVLCYVRDVIFTDNSADSAKMNNPRHIALALIFELSAKCLVDPIELLFKTDPLSDDPWVNGLPQLDDLDISSIFGNEE